MSSSSDDEIGTQAEQEYEETLPKKKSHSKGLPASERARIIANAINQQEDPYYKAYTKNGKWYVRKRKVPLDIPPSNSSAVIDVGEIPPKPDTLPEMGGHIGVPPNSGDTHKEVLPEMGEPPKEKPKNEWKQQFFSMQNTLNEDLKNTLAKVCERCDRIEKKYMKLKKEKAKKKIEKEHHVKREEVKFEDEEPQQQPVEEPEEPEMTKEEFYRYIRSIPPYKRGRYLNINEF